MSETEQATPVGAADESTALPEASATVPSETPDESTETSVDATDSVEEAVEEADADDPGVYEAITEVVFNDLGDLSFSDAVVAERFMFSLM